MIRLTQAIDAVTVCTMTSGAAGVIAGAALGQFAPWFTAWLYSPGPVNGQANFDPTEFALGLGIGSGLLGAGAGLFLVIAVTLGDAWLARSGVKLALRKPESFLD